MEKGKTLQPEWRHNIQNWTRITSETASLMLHLSERSLSETLASSESITKRSDQLIAITVPLLTVLIGFVVSGDINELGVDVKYTAACLALIPLVLAAIFVTLNLRPHHVSTPGEDPNKLARTEYIDNSFNGKEQYLNLVISMLQSYQLRIDNNERSNSKRASNNRRALLLLALLPFIPLASWVSCHLLSHQCF